VTDANPEYESCVICGRTILRGERVSEYVDGDGETVGVCELCKARAEAAGWVPAAYAATTSRNPERRRAWVGSALRERFARRLEAERGATQAPAEQPPSEQPQAPPKERTPLDVFNSSGEARKVAGLLRSLGEPRVSVRQPGPNTALIVVAWDLSWYRWRVKGGSVTELAKGNEISELPVSDREWNASAAEDGTLSLD
jgi:hypothetical protein